MRTALLVSALLTLMLLAGCAEDKSPAAPPVEGAPAAGNLGGAEAGKVVTSVFPGNYDFTGPRSNVLEKGTLAIKPAQRVIIDSDQGGTIEMGLNLPDTPEKVPILMFSTPYMDADGAISGATTHVNPSASVKSLIENFVPHGYAVVTHSVRGTGGSDGCNDLMGPGEVADIDQALTWLGTQSWSSGAIAMTGVSYDGSTPWSAAATGNPYLKTIIPISGVPDIYGLMYRNGSSETRGPLVLNALYVQGGIDSGSPASLATRLCPEAAEGLALSGVAGALGTDPSGYWQARNRKPAVEANYKGSVFSIQGLQDWNVDPSQVVPWVDQLEANGLETKQLLGQWGHAWPDGIGANGSSTPDFRADWKETLLRWMDKELKGLDVDVGAPVQVRDHLGRWRNEEHYPPHDATWTTYHLTSGLLSVTPGPAESALLYPQTGAADAFVPEIPSVAETSVKKAVDFVLPPQAEDLLIAGLPRIPLLTVPEGAGGYIGATLYARNGSTDTPIGWTTMNLGYADGTTNFKPVVPGQPLRAMLEIQPMDAVVKKGEQLVLRLWMLSDHDRIPTPQNANPVSVELGGSSDSVLLLPTVVRGPEVYFTPPIGPEGDKGA